MRQVARQILTLAAAAVLITGFCQCASEARWSVIDACWRPDENPFAKAQVWDNWIWAEGWGEDEQFWPKYFVPAGSLHIVLKNTSSETASLALVDVNGQKIEDIITTPERAGRVVWQSVFPEQVTAGSWVECVVRLRQVPARDVLLGFRTGDKRVGVTVPVEPLKLRMESVSFSPGIDRVYVYVRSLDGGRIRPGEVRLDGGPASNCTWTPGPAGSGLMLAECSLPSPWELGSFHLLEVMFDDGGRLTHPVRAWDSYFPIGLFGTIDEQRIEEAIERGFDTYVIGRESKLLDQMGINYVVRSGVGEGRMRVPGKQSGTLFYNNTDEPDAHDVTSGSSLPYMDRLGVNAELIVLPWYRNHIKKDPRTPSMCLTNNTYKPLNWYVYGQTSDIFCTDPYVPLGGEQVPLIAHSLECARDASAPNPLIATLWCTSMGGRTGARWQPPTPEQERLMTFYALGSGVKGVFYFADRDTQTGETLVSVVHNRPLWNEMGRINKDMAVLAPYLAVGCPAGPPRETEQVWYRSLMCGRNTMVLVVVNKLNHIGYNTQHGFSWHWPAKDVNVSVVLPEHFGTCSVSEVKNGILVPTQVEFTHDQATLRLDVVDTARAFVVSSE